MANVWKIAPGENASDWEPCRDNGCILLGWHELKNFLDYEDEEEILKALGGGPGNGSGAARSVHRFARVIKSGDVVVANNGKSIAVGVGRVSSDYLPPKSRKNPSKNRLLPHARLVDWVIKDAIDVGLEFFGIHTITRVTAEKVDQIKKAYLKEYPELEEKLDQLFPSGQAETKTRNKFPQSDNATMKILLEQLRQIILYGPPGTGKTREAKRVALAVLTGKDSEDERATDDNIEKQLKQYWDDGRFDLVVFHPAYEYEQFVGGIEPTVKEKQLYFEAKAGVFTRLCRNAEEKTHPVVLIIDEINRGHLPKLLGELVYALEYRGHKVTLPFACNGRTDLTVPKNLYVIATMNSADRSIGHIDMAIRRRFGLYPLEARPEIVQQVWSAAGDKAHGNQLAELMRRLNEKLGNRHEQGAPLEQQVGHSYFLPMQGTTGNTAKEQVRMKWTYQVQPLLREYAQLLNLGSDSLQEFFDGSLDNWLDQP